MSSRGTRQYFAAKMPRSQQSDEFKLNFQLISSIYQNDEESFDLLIDSVPNIEKSVGNGNAEWTLLMLAVHKKRLNMVQKLLAKGANPNCIDKKNKKSLLTVACSAGYGNITKLLLSTKKISNINYCDDDEGGALCSAVRRSRKFCVEQLLNYNLHQQICDINICTKNHNQTAIFIACERGDIEIVKLLINYKFTKCDLNIACDRGYTPLMRAVARRHFDIVQLLVSSDGRYNNLLPNMNLTNKYKQCCTMIAVKVNHFKISKLLLNIHNTNNNVLYHKDYKGRTILDQCKKYRVDKRIINYVKKILYTSIHSVLNSINTSKQTDIVPYIPPDVLQFICICTY